MSRTTNEVEAAPEARPSAQRLLLEAARVRLQACGEVEAPALGLSMGEGFDGADALVIVPRRGPPRPGQVVVFAEAERWVAHRVLVRCGGRVITQGDALWAPDWPPVPVSAVEGLVVAVVRGGRRFPVQRSPARAWRGALRALARTITRLWRR